MITSWNCITYRKFQRGRRTQRHVASRRDAFILWSLRYRSENRGRYRRLREDVLRARGEWLTFLRRPPLNFCARKRIRRINDPLALAPLISPNARRRIVHRAPATDIGLLVPSMVPLLVRPSDGGSRIPKMFPLGTGDPFSRRAKPERPSQLSPPHKAWDVSQRLLVFEREGSLIAPHWHGYMDFSSRSRSNLDILPRRERIYLMARVRRPASILYRTAWIFANYTVKFVASNSIQFELLLIILIRHHCSYSIRRQLKLKQWS